MPLYIGEKRGGSYLLQFYTKTDTEGTWSVSYTHLTRQDLFLEPSTPFWQKPAGKYPCLLFPGTQRFVCRTGNRRIEMCIRDRSESFYDSTQLSPFITINILSCLLYTSHYICVYENIYKQSHHIFFAYTYVLSLIHI